MQIEKINISKIRPYKRNAKIHTDKQIEQIKASIREFENCDPIAITDDNMIIEGHGRYEALKQLGYKEIDVIRLSHLTPEQVRAYNLVHNKLTMNTDFDDGLLNLELDDIVDIDMSEYGFDIAEEDEKVVEEPEEKQFHRDATNKHYNLDLFDPERCAGRYQMPVIRKESYIPKDLIGFNYVLNSREKNAGIHCFVDDYQFERLWNTPAQYIDPIAEYECFLTPDFSLYMDMPLAMKVWNVYRSRLIGQYYQDSGITVIPTVSWAESETFDFCFDGIEKGAVVAVSTIGVKREESSFAIWKAGMDEMIRRVEPAAILVYGGEVAYDYKGIKVYYYGNKVTEQMKATK